MGIERLNLYAGLFGNFHFVDDTDYASAISPVAKTTRFRSSFAIWLFDDQVN